MGLFVEWNGAGSAEDAEARAFLKADREGKEGVLSGESTGAKVGPKIGDVMPAGHPNAGWIYMGPDDDTGKDFYAAPKDESGLFSFNEAETHAQSIDAKVPTQSQLDKMYRNRDKGALKGTFNETGLGPAGWYRTSQDLYDSGYHRRFSDGYPFIIAKGNDSSLRLVR